MCPVVTEMGKAAAILEWAVTKMDERYELLAEAGCRDIVAYNSLTWEEIKAELNPQSEVEEAKIPRKLPYMVFVIDELADLMMTNKEVESSIVRIAQKARAVGIHLILATQRPQANVVTGLIKSNMPGPLAFKVASGMDSRIVLDQKGGELLLGQGDMLMITPRSSVSMRAQGTLVDDKEIRRVVRFVKDVSSPTFERSLMQLRSDGEPAPEHEFGSAEEHEARMRQSAAEDPLFERAVEIVIESQRGSVSLLQRRLAIGYTRASRLIELMGMAGIIGKHKGSVAREVMMNLEQWEQIRDYIKERGGFAGQQREATDADDALEAMPSPVDDERGLSGEADEAEDNEPPFDVDEPEEDIEDASPAAASVDQVELKTPAAAESSNDESLFGLSDELEAEADEDERRTGGDGADEEEGESEDEEVEYEDAEEGDDEGEYEEDEYEGEEEDGEYEYEYVDEDGNPIDPEEAEDYEYEDSEDDQEDEWEEEDSSEDDDDDSEEEASPGVVTRGGKKNSDSAA